MQFNKRFLHKSIKIIFTMNTKFYEFVHIKYTKTIYGHKEQNTIDYQKEIKQGKDPKTDSEHYEAG